VLPFENLGDSADAYFADGVADEVRGKLTGLPGLEVIARASSVQYRKSPRTPQQIAHELGVRYLLTGTVRWDKRGGSRVRVSPELIDAGRGGAPASTWQQPFDAALTDVFQVQADIATRVAQALGLALGDSARRQLVQRPTANLAAYDAYLKGEAVTGDFLAADPTEWPRGIKYYEQAVALDSGFVAAWVQLSRARSWQYAYLTAVPGFATGALEAAERARALAPDRPEPYLALGEYYSLVRLENGRALDAVETGLRLAPGDVGLLTTAGRTEVRLGRWEAARGRLAKTSELDPRSAVNWRRYGLALLLMRRYDQARVALDRALALVPTNPDVLGLLATLALAQGDTAQARAIVSKPPAGVDPTELAVWSSRINDLYWVLDDETQRRVLAQPPSAFANDRTSWAMVRAQIHHVRGELSLAQVWADTARLEFQKGVQVAPDKAEVRVFLGLALAYLGRKRDAIAEGERAVALAPISQDAFIGPYIQHQLVRIYLLAGEPEKALDRLEPLLKIPYTLSPGWLKIDPIFAPLRGNPRFERLVAADDPQFPSSHRGSPEDRQISTSE
jgi:serine/threonine-protein kinase